MVLVCVAVLLSMMLVVPFVRSAWADRPVIQSRWASTVPSIDGVFQKGEWFDPQIAFTSPTYPSSYVLPTYAYFSNDLSNLYVMVDAVGDTTQSVGDECAFVLNFDPVTRVIVFVTAGDGSGPTGVTATVGFGGSPNDATPHRIYEFSIPLTLIKMIPGQSVDFSSPNVYFKPSMSYDPATGHDNVWPLNLDYLSKDTWGILSLSSGAPVVGGVVMPTDALAVLSPWLAVIGLVGCVAVVVVVVKRRRS
jgi:hypothetical protein